MAPRWSRRSRSDRHETRAVGFETALARLLNQRRGWRASSANGGAGGSVAWPLVLRIEQATYDAIVGHAKRDHPNEACGIVAGPEGSDRAERWVEMVNAAASPTFYEFEPTELLALYRELWANDEEPVVIYHSHTATEAYPSRTDIGLASEPGAHYVLVGTREHGNNPGPVEFRSYRIVDGVVTEEPVEVVESYRFAHTGPDDVPEV